MSNPILAAYRQAAPERPVEWLMLQWLENAPQTRSWRAADYWNALAVLRRVDAGRKR